MPRPQRVVGFGGVVDDGPPAAEVGGGLVGELLPVQLIALVRVHVEERILVHQEEVFLDRARAVGSVGSRAAGDVRGEFPRVSGVRGGVDVDLG